MKTILLKSIYILIATALLFFAGSRANAQSAAAGKFRLGIGVDALVPVGNTKTTQNFALGLTPRLQYSVSNRFALIFTSGIYHFFPKSFPYPSGSTLPPIMVKFRSEIIPVKLGAKVFLSNNFYFSGEAGAAFEVARYAGERVHFLWSPGIGYATKRWDIGARYEDFSGNGYSDGAVALRVAYGFGL